MKGAILRKITMGTGRAQFAGVVILGVKRDNDAILIS